MSDAIRSFRDPVVRQRASEFAKEVYRISEQFPRTEVDGIRAQVRRAGVSISSNIAEGHARQGREFLRFISIARGSLAEAESQLSFAVAMGYVQPSELETSDALAFEIRCILVSLTRKLQTIQTRKP